MQKHIAIVEDDPDQRANYCDALVKKGYQVSAYANRGTALEGFSEMLPDLVILDIVLEGEEDAGFDLCRSLLQRAPELPVLFLTERTDEVDKISGLRLGAWDYLSKPISLQYLAERVASLLRIIEPSAIASQEQGARIGHLEVDLERLSATWRGIRVPLSGTELRMLQMLVEHPDSAVSYAKLMSATNQPMVTNNTINTHMRNIRRKFVSIDGDFSCISNEYGFGYRWIAQS
ncbi:MAG: response regulator transcription factor [Gammaproteobacteria bacterium]|nr:response regulator transcription factor [Gammaproteobacteria bacterium]